MLSEDRKIFAFHTHGDYSTEWVKCLEFKSDQGKYEVKTALFPESKLINKQNNIAVMTVERPYLLLDQNENLP